MRLFAMAGLPGTGKSALAREIVAQTGCPCFDKDRVREALFGPFHVEYSSDQDDFVVRTLLAAIARTSRAKHDAIAVLDGRTFTRRAHVEELLAFGKEASIEVVFVECRTTDAVARARIELDLRSGAHVAKNRDLALYERLREASERFPSDLADARHIVLHTDDRAPADLAREVIQTFGLA